MLDTLPLGANFGRSGERTAPSAAHQTEMDLVAPHERRAEPRQRLTEYGMIAVDEHTSLPCMIYDLSRSGARLVSLDTVAVPDTFVLSADRFGGACVCSVAWRTAEEMGVKFARPLS